jgi:hypothetical protein
MHAHTHTHDTQRTKDIKEFKEFMTRSDSGKADAKNAGFEWYVSHGSPFAGVNNAAAGDQSDAESNGADVTHNGEPDVPYHPSRYPCVSCRANACGVCGVCGVPNIPQSSRDDEAVNPALYASYVDEGDGAAAAAELDRLPTPGEEGPVMASSGLRFLQYIGKYLQLMVRAVTRHSPHTTNDQRHDTTHVLTRAWPRG